MPISVTSFLVPSNAISMVVADIDVDGQAEVIIAAKDDQVTVPPGITLYSYEMERDGTLKLDKSYPMGRKAMYWEIQQGLWGMDASGLVDLKK